MTKDQKAAVRAMVAAMAASPAKHFDRQSCWPIADWEPFVRMIRRAKGRQRIVTASNRLFRTVAAKKR